MREVERVEFEVANLAFAEAVDYVLDFAAGQVRGPGLIVLPPRARASFAALYLVVGDDGDDVAAAVNFIQREYAARLARGRQMPRLEPVRRAGPGPRLVFGAVRVRELGQLCIVSVARAELAVPEGERIDVASDDRRYVVRREASLACA